MEVPVMLEIPEGGASSGHKLGDPKLRQTSKNELLQNQMPMDHHFSHEKYHL
jgi:hypothetical protein